MTSSTPKAVLLVTVGTGTAGRHSNVAEGIMAAVRKSAPDLFFLMPSSSEASRAVADIVREGLADNRDVKFEPATTSDPYFLFSNPDDLELCRRDFGRVFEQISARHKNARIRVNPTSGTKQMTAAATVAALEAGVDSLEFIAGDRADGVVKTGTERVAGFSPRIFMAERAMRDATILIDSGAYAGAALILKRHKAICGNLYHGATMLAEWDRMRYGPALDAARELKGRVGLDMVNILTSLAAWAPGKYGLPRIGDLAAGSKRCLDLGRPEEALARLYRMVEFAAKWRLGDRHDLHEPFTMKELDAKLPPDLSADIGKRSGGTENPNLGLRATLQVLRACRDSMGALLNDKNLTRLMDARNESMYGHGTKGCDEDGVRQGWLYLTGFLSREMTGLEYWITACAFPAAKRFLEENEP